MFGLGIRRPRQKPGSASTVAHRHQRKSIDRHHDDNRYPAARVHAVPAVSGMAGGESPVALLLDLSGGEAVLHRPAADRAAVDLRANFQPLDGALERRADDLDDIAVSDLAFRKRVAAGRAASGLRPAISAAAGLYHGRYRCA